jgi:hypothetical protein
MAHGIYSREKEQLNQESSAARLKIPAELPWRTNGGGDW